MSRHRRVSASLALCAATLIALSACASADPDSPVPASDQVPGAGPVVPAVAPPENEVRTQGMVMDTGTSVELCLGAIRESYPPQCDGLPIAGWTWDGVDGSESSGAVRWGSYALQGTFDGDVLTLTQPPIMLALYDPIALPSPPDEPGTLDEKTLRGIQDDLAAALGDAHLFSLASEGRLLVDVVWDDGSIQAACDELYGPGAVIVRSALRGVGD